MKIKSLVIIIATVISTWVALSILPVSIFDKICGGGGAVFLKSDNYSASAVVLQRSFRSKLSDAAFSSVSEPVFIREFREQPVLAACLILFYGASIFGVGLVVYLIRTDCAV